MAGNQTSGEEHKLSGAACKLQLLHDIRGFVFISSGKKCLFSFAGAAGFYVIRTWEDQSTVNYPTADPLGRGTCGFLACKQPQMVRACVHLIAVHTFSQDPSSLSLGVHVCWNKQAHLRGLPPDTRRLARVQVSLPRSLSDNKLRI